LTADARSLPRGPLGIIGGRGQLQDDAPRPAQQRVPAAVGDTPCGARSKSLAPSSLSRLAIALDSVWLGDADRGGRAAEVLVFGERQGIAYVTTDGGHTAIEYHRPGSDGIIRPAQVLGVQFDG
jgi:hypothetical protein